MKSKWHLQLSTGMVVTVVVIVVAAALVPLSVAGLLSMQPASPHSVQSSGVSVSGDYDGSVTLSGVYKGVYTESAATPTAMDLGYIDLALHLDQAGSAVTGYVALDRVLVFTSEHTIMATPVGPTPVPPTPAPTPHPLDIGPLVQGTFDGVKLHLESEPFSLSLNARTVTRRFSLDSTSVEDDGATVKGTYRETIWGYDAEPSTAVGAFSLQRPVYGLAQQLNKRVYLPIIIKQ